MVATKMRVAELHCGMVTVGDKERHTVIWRLLELWDPLGPRERRNDYKEIGPQRAMNQILQYRPRTYPAPCGYLIVGACRDFSLRSSYFRMQKQRLNRDSVVEITKGRNQTYRLNWS